MRAAVTGVTGFIGTCLAKALHGSGHEVVALGMVNNEVEQDRRAELEGSGIGLREGSIADRAYLDEALAGCDVVFHLAAAQHEADASEAHFHAVNVDGTRNVLDAAVASGVKRIVHGSTIGVYGEGVGDPLDEASPTRPDNLYGRTKLAGERVALEYNEKLPVVVIRISETYGGGDRRLLKLFRGIEKGIFFIAGDGQNLHQLIYVDDLVKGLIAAATAEDVAGEIFLLAGSEAVSTIEMCAHAAAALGARPPWLRLPLWPFLGLASIFETVCPRIGIKPPIHRRRLDFFRKTFLINGDKAKERLGFEPAINFEDGARRTVQWYREKGLLQSGR